MQKNASHTIRDFAPVIEDPCSTPAEVAYAEERVYEALLNLSDAVMCRESLIDAPTWWAVNAQYRRAGQLVDMARNRRGGDRPITVLL